jgi:hypothetical protein
MKGSFAKREALLDEVSQDLLTRLVHLGGYCTALQAEGIGVRESGKRVRARLRILQRLGFLRRVTKYPIVYQVTKSAIRLHGPDSSSRRRHTLATVEARLLGVHFYLEATSWPAYFVFDHDEKIMTFQNAGCPLSVLRQRNGKPYLREHFVLWFPSGRITIASIELPQPGIGRRFRRFIREYLPLLRHLRHDLDLLIVTADKRRAYTYQRLLRTNPTIQKLVLGSLAERIKPYCVRPPVPSITELTWPRAETDNWEPEYEEQHNPAQNYADQGQVWNVIED